MMATVPAVEQCPEPVETATLHFKSLSKLKVINTEGVYDSKTSLLAVSHNYGLTFIGTWNGFLIIKSKYIFAGSNVDQYQKEIVLNCRTTHIATDHDGNHLAVGCLSNVGLILYIYNLPSFLTKGVSPIKTVPLSKPFQVNQICEMLWQPNSENGLTVSFSDGSVSSLSLFQGSGNDIFSLPPTTQARCMCWSPKGKQIVIGCQDGSLSQYKPDLKFVKKLNPPLLFNGAATIVSVLWISNFQFLAAYKDANKTDDFPVVVIVNAPKNEPIRFIDFDDITYSSVHFRRHQFYFQHMVPWNLIFVASANSIEVAVLHAREDNSTWEQWLLGDASRAELPLNNQKSETFPLGMCFDYTSDQAIPWGEGLLSPMPILMLLSSEGVLITFNVINTSPTASKLCFASEKVFDDSWFGVKEKNSDVKEAVNVNQSAESSQFHGRALEISKTPQIFPSTFASLPSMSLNTQENAATAAGTLNLKFQPQKQQTVSPVQQQLQQTQTQTMQFQVPVQTGAASIFQNPNSPSKWSQKPSFPFSLSSNSPKAPESVNIPGSKANDNFKSPEPNVAPFAVKPAMGQGSQHSESKDLSGKSENSTQSSAEEKATIPANLITEQNNLIAAAVADESKRRRVKTPDTSPSRGTPEAAAVDDSVYVAALWDEIDHFNAELREVISRVSGLRVKIGTEEEKTLLRNRVQKLNDLQKSLSEATSNAKIEVNAIKCDVMEAFAWLEDARSRNRQRKSPTFIELKNSQDLDPMSNRLMSEINHLEYYIVNQLKQLYSSLWKESMEHQDSCRLEIKKAMAIPSMEELYKTMHLELKILHKQRAIVEDLRRRVKERNLKNRGDGALITGSVRNYSGVVDNSRISELFKLADNLLQINIGRDEEKSEIGVVDACQVMIKNQINAIAERSKKFTPEKQNLLRDILSEREMLKTRSVKSNFTSSSFIRNASSAMYSKALLSSKRREGEKVGEGDAGAASERSVGVEPSPEGKVVSPVAEKSGEMAAKEVAAAGKSPSDCHKPGESFMFPVGKPSSEEAVSTIVGGEQQKATPFVFKASSSASQVPAASNLSVTKSVPSAAATVVTCCRVSTSTVNAVTCSSGSTPPVFAFKFADVPSTTSTPSTFSFTANKTSSAFSPRTDVSFSGSVFGVPQTAAGDGPIQTSTQTTSSAVFSFASNVSSPSAKENSDSIFGSTSNLFQFSASLSKTNSGNSIFSSPSSSPSEAVTSAVVTPTTRPKSGIFSQSSVTTPVKSGQILPPGLASESGTVVMTSAEPFGRSSSKATTAVASAVTATSNAPPTTTNATISTVVATIAASPAAATTSNIAVSIIPSSLTGVVSADSSDDSQAIVESEVVHATDEVEQDTQDRGKTEEVKTVATVADVSAEVPPPTAVPVKAEEESSGPPAAFSSTTSVFSSATPSSAIFSMPSSTVVGASNSGSIFGQTVSAAASTANIFSTTTSNIFSPTKAATTTSSALFSTTSTSQGSIFGQPAATTANTGNIFGQVTSTTSTSSFGQPSKGDEVGQTAKLFGDVLGSSLSSRNIFETPTSTNTSGNIFGKSSGSIFGNAAAATTTSSTPTGASAGIFGAASSNIFSKNLVPQTQMPTSTSSGIFGQPQNTDSGNTFFGQNICNTFGSSGVTTSPNQNPFASASGFNSKPVFGQSLFGQNPTGQNPFDRSQSSSIFGGSSSTTQNVFQTGSTSFGGLSPGPFSGGQSTTAQTGIGGTSAFQKPMGGSIFGSSPSFTRSGATPTFGEAPTFGSPATFGTPKVFGSPQGTFGQNQANAPTFGALANQTDGFANLALQSQSQSPAFGGNTFNQNSNFGGESSFGGTSFSSWRS